MVTQKWTFTVEWDGTPQGRSDGTCFSRPVSETLSTNAPQPGLCRVVFIWRTPRPKHTAMSNMMMMMMKKNNLGHLHQLCNTDISPSFLHNFCSVPVCEKTPWSEFHHHVIPEKSSSELGRYLHLKWKITKTWVRSNRTTWISVQPRTWLLKRSLDSTEQFYRRQDLDQPMAHRVVDRLD